MKKILFSLSIILILTSTSVILYFAVPQQTFKKLMFITSDDDLEKLNLPGSGTINNPYVIEQINFGLMITDVQDYISLLFISGTSKHIAIRNNTFIGGFIGIQIDSIVNGSITIENNYFAYEELCIDSFCITSYYGIKISNSSNIKINDNTFKESNYEGYIYGIFFEESGDLEIKNNQLSSFYGIYGIHSDTFVINNNTYFETVDVYIEFCSNFNITKNIHDFLFRYKIVNSNSIYISENSILGKNISFGFLIYDCSDVIIRENFFDKNIVGVRMTGSYNSLLIHNNFSYGLSHAIELGFDTFHNQILGNFFYYNNLEAVLPLQAYDSGSSNNWYDSENEVGNFWSNLGLNSTYEIDGTANSIDAFPESL